MFVRGGDCVRLGRAIFLLGICHSLAICSELLISSASAFHFLSSRRMRWKFRSGNMSCRIYPCLRWCFGLINLNIYLNIWYYEHLTLSMSVRVSRREPPLPGYRDTPSRHVFLSHGSVCSLKKNNKKARSHFKDFILSWYQFLLPLGYSFQAPNKTT